MPFKTSTNQYDWIPKIGIRTIRTFLVGGQNINWGFYQSAIYDFNEVIHLKPEFVWAAYRDRGLCKARLGKHAAAIEDYNEAIKLKPDGAFAYYNRALSYIELGKTAESNTDFDKAMALAQKQGNTQLQEKLRSARK